MSESVIIIDDDLIVAKELETFIKFSATKEITIHRFKTLEELVCSSVDIRNAVLAIVDGSFPEKEGEDDVSQIGIRAIDHLMKQGLDSQKILTYSADEKFLRMIEKQNIKGIEKPNTSILSAINEILNQ